MAKKNKIAGVYVEIATQQELLDKGLSQAHGKTTRFATQQQGLFRRMVSGMNSSLGSLGLIGTGLIGFASFRGISSIFSTIVQASAASESSQIKLRTTLATTGNEVEKNAERLNKFADRMRDTANVDDDDARKLVSYGLNLGVTTDKIEQMTEAAFGLAEVTGDDGPASMEKLVKANQGSFKALEKQLPLLKKMKSEEEKLAYVQKISAQGMEQRRAQLKGAAGATQQLKLATGELSEDIGGSLSPGLTKLAQGATIAVNKMRELRGTIGTTPLGKALGSPAGKAAMAMWTGGLSLPYTEWFNPKQPTTQPTSAGEFADWTPPEDKRTAGDLVVEAMRESRARADRDAAAKLDGGSAGGAIARMLARYAPNQSRSRRADETIASRLALLNERRSQVTGAALAQTEAEIERLNKWRAGTPEEMAARNTERMKQREVQIRTKFNREKDVMGSFIAQQEAGITPPRTPFPEETRAAGWIQGVIRESGRMIFGQIDKEMLGEVDRNTSMRDRMNERLENVGTIPGGKQSRGDSSSLDERLVTTLSKLDRTTDTHNKLLGDLTRLLPKLANRPATYSK